MGVHLLCRATMPWVSTGMRIVLRDRENGRFFRADGSWMTDPLEAMFFESKSLAFRFARARGLPDTEIVLVGPDDHRGGAWHPQFAPGIPDSIRSGQPADPAERAS